MQLKTDTTLQNGKYRIIRSLGQGGFGITYEAEQVLLRRKVAVKEFFMKDCCERDSSTSHVTVGTGSQRELVEKFRGKFIREAQMIASMNHPHIVRVIDVFEENDTAYYVMENLPGGSLADKVKKEGPLRESVAEQYIRQVAEALDYIHSQNTVHLDVKPSNILLNGEGEAVLIDFGISKHYDEAGQQTSSTPVGISKGYAPLEQGRDGDVSQFKPTTDIYALGGTLYYLVTGAVPPEASVVNEDGLERPKGISEKIWKVIEAAMQPRRKDRPQSVAAFLSLLGGPSGAIDAHGGDVDEEITELKGDSGTGAKSSGVTAAPSSSSSSSAGLQNPPQVPSRKPSRKGLWIALTSGVAALVAVLLLLPSRQKADSLLINGLQEYTAEFESATGEQTFEIKKSFKESWTYSDVPEWSTASASNGQFSVSVTENKSREERTSIIVFKKKGGDEELCRLNIKQKGSSPARANGSAAQGIDKTGSARINTTPAGAQIWLDGKNTKKVTPDILEDVSAGKHSVKLVLEGYEDYTGSVNVTEGKRAELSRTLTAKEKPAQQQQQSQPSATQAVPETPRTGSARINSTPAGAQIWLDGKNTKKVTPDILEDVSAGKHSVKLVLEGYEDYTGSVNVTEGKRAELSRTLTAKEKPAQQQTQAQGQTTSNASAATTGTINGHDWVDLGLSVKWATCNVGASSPSDYGRYYAWGETSTKNEYTWTNYQFRASGDSYDNVTFSKYNTTTERGTVDNKTRLERSEDAARSNWGGTWRIPTDAEWTELRTKGKWTWTTQGGKNGYKVIGPNGNSIFLPAAGYRNGTNLDYAGSRGFYWSSSLGTDLPRSAWGLSFYSGDINRYSSYRFYGFSIRPVSE